MSFKELMNKMAEKQAESDAKIKESKIKMAEAKTQLSKSFDDLKSEKAKERAAEKKEEQQYQKNRLEQLKRDHVPYCPKCYSTSITYVDKKLSLGRAVIGQVVDGNTGAILGGLSSKKGKLKCLNCGHVWKI